MEVHCSTCGKIIHTYLCRTKHDQYCSKECFSKGVSPKLKAMRAGAKNPAWKGGVHKAGQGYRRLTLSSLSEKDQEFAKPMAIRMGSRPTILEHRFLMAKALGRPLQSYEIVHHKNGIHDDNRLENLELMTTRQDHYLKHPFIVCPKCGYHFPAVIKDGQYSF